MKKIYKYNVPIQDGFTLELPDGYKILHFGMQDKKAYLWVLVDPDSKLFISCRFQIKGTGHSIDESELMNYVGTIITNNDRLVWHLFRVVPSPFSH